MSDMNLHLQAIWGICEDKTRILDSIVSGNSIMLNAVRNVFPDFKNCTDSELQSIFKEASVKAKNSSKDDKTNNDYVDNFINKSKRRNWGSAPKKIETDLVFYEIRRGKLITLQSSKSKITEYNHFSLANAKNNDIQLSVGNKTLTWKNLNPCMIVVHTTGDDVYMVRDKKTLVKCLVCSEDDCISGNLIFVNRYQLFTAILEALKMLGINESILNTFLCNKYIGEPMWEDYFEVVPEGSRFYKVATLSDDSYLTYNFKNEDGFFHLEDILQIIVSFLSFYFSVINKNISDEDLNSRIDDVLSHIELLSPPKPNQFHDGEYSLAQL